MTFIIDFDSMTYLDALTLLFWVDTTHDRNPLTRKKPLNVKRLKRSTFSLFDSGWPFKNAKWNFSRTLLVDSLKYYVPKRCVTMLKDENKLKLLLKDHWYYFNDKTQTMFITRRQRISLEKLMLFLYSNEFDAKCGCFQYFNDSVFHSLNSYYVRYDHLLRKEICWVESSSHESIWS